MNFDLFAVLSYSIFIAAGIGLFRFRKLSRAYHPFILYTVIASLNEIFSYMIVKYGGLSNNANNNIYTLLEALVITWQFHRWRLFNGASWQYYSLQALLILGWLSDCWASGDWFIVLHRFRIGYALVIVMLSLSQLNRLMYGNGSTLVKNTRFLVCAGFIVLFTFKIITELFWLYGSTNSVAFLYKVYEGFGFINLIINLSFILAVLWIPRKPRFITFT